MANDPIWWMKQHSQLIWSQVFLILLAALGFVDFFRQMLFYTVECEIAALITIFFYSRTFDVGFSKFTDWLAANVMLMSFMISVWVWTHNAPTKGSASLYDVFNALPLALVYWIVQFSIAWYRSRGTKNPRYAFFTTALFPSSLFALVFTAFIMSLIFGLAHAAVHFQVEGNDLFSWGRLNATILVTLGAALRVAFAWVWANPANVARAYGSNKAAL